MNYAANSYNKAKTLKTNIYSNKQKRSNIRNKRNARNIFMINLARVVKFGKIISNHDSKSENENKII